MNKMWRSFAALLLISSSTAFSKQPLVEIEQKEVAVPANVTLNVRLAEGTVHVYGADGPVIKLVAIKKAYTKERLERIKVNVKLEGDAAAIETTLPPKETGLSTADRSGTVDYILLVPQTCSIAQLEVETGEIIVEGMRGAGLNVRLTNGRMLVKNCFTATNLSLGRGGMDLGYMWWEEGSFSLNAQSAIGDLRVVLPPTANAKFDAATGDGWIKNQFAPEQSEGPRSLQWTMGSEPAAAINLRAQSGNIRIEKAY